MTSRLSTINFVSRYYAESELSRSTLQQTYFPNYFAIKIICKCVHLYWVLHLSIGSDVIGCTNSTCFQLHFPSILCPCLEDFCLRVTRMYLKFLIRKLRGRKNSICIQICLSIFIYACLFKVISLIKNLIILPRQYAGLRILFVRHKFTFRCGSYIPQYNYYIFLVPR